MDFGPVRPLLIYTIMTTVMRALGCSLEYLKVIPLAGVESKGSL